LINGFFLFSPYKKALWYSYTPPENEGAVHRRYHEIQDMILPNSAGVNVSLFTRQYAAIPTFFHENEHYKGDLNESSVHVKTYFFSKNVYAKYNPELAAYDGVFLTLHKMLGRRVPVNRVYELNDLIERYYGTEMSEEDADRYTDRFVEQYNTQIAASNRALSWNPEIRWPLLTEDEDAANFLKLHNLLKRYYTRRITLSKGEFSELFAEAGVHLSDAGDNRAVPLTTEEKAEAKAAYDTLIATGYFGSMVQKIGKGEEPIEWIKIGESAEETLFMSKKCLAVRRFQDGAQSADWVNCDLREWLNSSFVRRAFGRCDRALLRGGLNLLSEKEAKKLTDALETTDIDVIPYPPVLHPVYGSQTAERKPQNNAWWLRSDGTKGPDYAAVVYYHGALHKNGYHKHNAKCGVRPVIAVGKPQ
jgi:hypothetical protein